MESLNPIEWEVLNATADVAENLEQIYGSLRKQTTTTTLSEVADAVHALAQKGLVVARMDENGQPWPSPLDPSSVWRAWFAMTPEGREVWAAPSIHASLPPHPQGRLYRGVWKDLAVDIPLEEFQEVRREMSRNFPRDFPRLLADHHR